jgi:hypothetical protein
MTKTVKIAVSLPALVADRARHAVRRGYAASVSAYVASALEEKAKLDELSALLSEMLAESGGPLTKAERRAADRALGLAPAVSGKRGSTAATGHVSGTHVSTGAKARGKKRATR